MKENGRLTILVGIDGSGKSTLVNGLEQNGYETTHWRKLKQICPDLNFTTPAEMVQTLDGEERLVFILNYIQSEWKHLIQPVRESGVDVISDGFFARFYAKESIYKRLNVDNLKRHCPLSGDEIFIMLDTPSSIALERKGLDSLSPYEYLNVPDDFTLFQSRQKEELLTFIKDYQFYILDGKKVKEELLGETIDILKNNVIFTEPK